MATLETAIPVAGNPILNNAEQVQPTNKEATTQPSSWKTTVKPAEASAGKDDIESAVGDKSDQSKASKLGSLFGFGKKKEDEKTKKKKKDGVESKATDSDDMDKATNRVVEKEPTRRTPPPIKNHPYNLPASPHRNLLSSSPRPVSPAGSQIFERDVLDSAPPLPNSSAIPSHIQTEDHIPAVLDASSEAITNSNINPDSVEIVMHSAHQPAAVTVTGATPEPSGVWGEESTNHLEDEHAPANYAALDGADIRRLSFISFQDIVQAEHAEQGGNRDSIYVAGLSSLSSPHNRSPSPIRSPISSPGRDTPPPSSQSASVGGLSPQIRPFGSPVHSSHQAPATSGELTIETMTQALRRTASGDLSGVRSQPLSPSTPTDGKIEKTSR